MHDYLHVNVPHTPGTPASSAGRALPPPPKQAHLDWTTRRNLDRQLVAATAAGESAFDEGVLASHPDSTVSGVLCATDVVEKGGSGKPAVGHCAPRLGDLSSGSGALAVGLCAPRLSMSIPGSELVPLEGDSFDAAGVSGFQVVGVSSSGGDNLTDGPDRPNSPTPNGGGINIGSSGRSGTADTPKFCDVKRRQ